MKVPIRSGDCVKLPDGRIARVRAKLTNKFKVRVRRSSSDTNQFILIEAARVSRVHCPKGWMSSDGYNRYLRTTLQKMRQRLR